MKKSFIIALVLAFTVAITPYIALAEEEVQQTETVEPPPIDEADGGDENDPPPPPDDEDPDAPIDGGLGILIAGGIGYGIKKYRSAKKERSKE
jgi:hypothetical protein